MKKTTEPVSGMLGRGKGKGAMLKMMKRHQYDDVKARTAISDAVLRRMCRRGGNERVKREIYRALLKEIRETLKPLVRDMIVAASFARRRTIKDSDVEYALKRRGLTLIGGAA